MKVNKTQYSIINSYCIVYRKGGIREYDNFSFLVDKTYFINSKSASYDILEQKLKSQIDFYNQFCPEDDKIIKFEDANFEKTGELWL